MFKIYVLMCVASISARVCVYMQIHAPDTQVHVHVYTEWPKEGPQVSLLFLSAYSSEAESLLEPGGICFLLSFT